MRKHDSEDTDDAEPTLEPAPVMPVGEGKDSD